MPAKKKTAADTITKKTVKKAAASAAKPKAAAEIKKTAASAEKDKVTKTAAKKAAKKTAKAEKEPVQTVSTEEVKKEATAAKTVKSPVKKSVPAAKAEKAEAAVKEAKPAAKAEKTEAAVKEVKPAAKAEKAEAAVKEAKPAAKAEKAEAAVKEAKPAAKAEKAEAAVKEAKPAAKAEKAEAAVKEAKPAAKAAEKKETEKKKVQSSMELNDEKAAFYATLDDGTRVEIMKNMGIVKDLDTLKREIARELDVPAYIEDLIIKNVPADKKPVFDEDGYDLSIVPYTVLSIYEALPVKASDHADVAKRIEYYKDVQLTPDALENTEIYNSLFDLVKEVLMTAQQNDYSTLEQVQEKMPGDLRKLIENFMDVAYNVLPSWQYKDVKYYQGFLFSVLSQFEDLSDLHNRAMMDVADLYIKHGDYGRGDADYNYVIRENDLKDYIYYRFANVYRPIDLQKAKSIAGSALQYVDGRYTYYPNIMEILHS